MRNEILPRILLLLVLLSAALLLNRAKEQSKTLRENHYKILNKSQKALVDFAESTNAF